MKIVLWIGDAPNQWALAMKIHRQYPIHTICVEKRVAGRRSLMSVIKALASSVFLYKLSGAWTKTMLYYKNNYPEKVPCNSVFTDNINSQKIVELSSEIKPDLIIVSGTSLIKKKLLSIRPPKGILNLHTGLSPYIKGGPNCTNWCLASNQFHLIGNTIMWIDEGIDTGNLILTGQTSFTGNETLDQVHLKVMEHAHELYLKAIEAVVKGNAPNIPQDKLGKGKTYYNKEWTLMRRLEAIRNFRKFKETVNSIGYERKKREVKTVELNRANL